MRVLRLRELLEEQERQRAETAAALLRVVEGEREAAKGEAVASRGRWFIGFHLPATEAEEEQASGGATEMATDVAAGGAETLPLTFAREPGAEASSKELDRKRWEEESCWKLADLRRLEADFRRPALEEAILRAQAELLSRRRERLEIETLIDTEQRHTKTRAERRQQGELDAWFLSRRKRSARQDRLGKEGGTGGQEPRSIEDAGMPTDREKA